MRKEGYLHILYIMLLQTTLRFDFIFVQIQLIQTYLNVLTRGTNNLPNVFKIVFKNIK